MSRFVLVHRGATPPTSAPVAPSPWLRVRRPDVTRPGDAVERAAQALAQRAEAAGRAGVANTATGSPGRHRVTVTGAAPSSGGRPLDPAVRNEMEGAFGHDFTRVRVHSGHEASAMAHHWSARAYSVGHDIVLGRGESFHGPGGRRLLLHELAHVVQYDLSGRMVIARQNDPPAAAPEGVLGRTVIQYEETPLSGGRVRLRVWGRVGDPIARPGLEKKYPLPGQLGLQGYDRWHLAGPDAIGAEAGIAYTPKNFNISRTAVVENVMRRARDAVEKQGGEVFFDFTADCRILGERQGVTIRAPEDVHWKAEVRAAGSDKLVPILNERATVPPAPPLAGAPAAPSPSPASPVVVPPAAAAAKQGAQTSPAPESVKPLPPAPESGPKVAAPGPAATAVPAPGAAPPVPAPGAKTPAPVPGAPVVRPPLNWKEGLKAGGKAVAFALAFAALDIYFNMKLQEQLEKDIEQAKKGAMPWAQRLKAKDPGKPVYITIKITAIQYQQYVPFAGVGPHETRLDFSGFELGERNVQPPVVDVKDVEWDLLHPVRPFGRTTKVTYSEPLIP
uniref:eCIS core domain-containing protein n=1 Tax=Streptomyces roseoverticillatus TaxID=66429 RepID=A0A0S3TVR7_9ACTN|nr:hypothetical protein [Streptomyces roseoverticillatus]